MDNHDIMLGFIYAFRIRDTYRHDIGGLHGSYGGSGGCVGSGNRGRHLNQGHFHHDLRGIRGDTRILGGSFRFLFNLSLFRWVFYIFLHQAEAGEFRIRWQGYGIGDDHDRVIIRWNIRSLLPFLFLGNGRRTDRSDLFRSHGRFLRKGSGYRQVVGTGDGNIPRC